MIYKLLRRGKKDKCCKRYKKKGKDCCKRCPLFD